MDGRKQYPDDDVRFSNAPIFNFNDGKVKFDANRSDNANDNYGSASGFVSKSLSNRKGIHYGYPFVYSVLTERIQPPSILPISSIGASRAMYFLLSMVFTSFIRRMNTRSIFSLRLARSSAGSFSFRCSPLACMMASSTSRMAHSHLSKTVNRSCFGTSLRYWINSLYKSYDFLNIGISKSFMML